MGKVWGLIFIVAAVYVGMEYYTVGGDKAFGGALAWMSEPLSSGKEIGGGDQRKLTERVRTKVTDDINLGFDRKDEILDED